MCAKVTWCLTGTSIWHFKEHTGPGILLKLEVNARHVCLSKTLVLLKLLYLFQWLFLVPGYFATQMINSTENSKRVHLILAWWQLYERVSSQITKHIDSWKKTVVRLCWFIQKTVSSAAKLLSILELFLVIYLEKTICLTTKSFLNFFFMQRCKFKNADVKITLVFQSCLPVTTWQKLRISTELLLVGLHKSFESRFP